MFLGFLPIPRVKYISSTCFSCVRNGNFLYSELRLMEFGGVFLFLDKQKIRTLFLTCEKESVFGEERGQRRGAEEVK